MIDRRRHEDIDSAKRDLQKPSLNMALVKKNDFEYVTDSGCLSVKVHLKDKDEEERTKSEKCQFPFIGIAELSDHGSLLRSLIAEFIGTLLLVFVGCGSCLGDAAANTVRIALCFGITVATLAQTIGHVSGCHINPAVSLALIIGAKIGIVKGFLYIVFQCLGAMTGAAILRAVVPSEIRGYAALGATGLGENVTPGQGIVIEMIITAILVMVIFAAAADQLNTPTVKGSAPLAIGLSITTCHLFAIPFTGSSMNPARSLGPAVVLGQYINHWVYWVGPLLGGLIGALVYQLLFRARAETPVSSSKPKNRFEHEMSPEYQPSGNESAQGAPDRRSRELVYIENNA